MEILTQQKKERLMSVKEYADLKEISVQAVYKAIKAGRIKSKKIATFTLIVIEE